MRSCQKPRLHELVIVDDVNLPICCRLCLLNGIYCRV